MSVNSLDPKQMVTIAVLYKGEPNETSHGFSKKIQTIRVSAPLPETFTFANANQIEQTFSWFQLKDTLLKTVSGISGIGDPNISLSRGMAERQYWSGPENSEFSFDMEFVAYKSGMEDVVIPTRNLLLLSAAVPRGAKADNTADTGSISSVAAIWTAPPVVNVIFGDVFRLPLVWIKNVSVAYSNKLDNNFHPLSAIASVSVVPRNPYGAYEMYGGAATDTQNIFASAPAAIIPGK